MKKELTVKDLENFFSPIDDVAAMLIKNVRNGMAKAFQDEKGAIDFEWPVECKDCPDDCENCARKKFTFKS